MAPKHYVKIEYIVESQVETKGQAVIEAVHQVPPQATNLKVECWSPRDKPASTATPTAVSTPTPATAAA